MYFAFRTPEGDHITDDVEAALRHAMLFEDDAFWSVGSGDAALLGGMETNPVQLWLTFDGEDGFQLKFVGPGQVPKTAWRSAPGHGDQSDTAAAPGDAVVDVSGDAIVLPGATRFGREQALRIAEHFCQTLRPDPSVRWD